MPKPCSGWSNTFFQYFLFNLKYIQFTGHQSFIFIVKLGGKICLSLSLVLLRLLVFLTLGANLEDFIHVIPLIQDALACVTGGKNKKSALHDNLKKY